MDNMTNIQIGNKLVGTSQPVYVIAEAGVNHNGDFELARKLIDAAHEAGADAVKFQTFTPEEMVTDKADQAQYQTENTGIEESQAAMLNKLTLKPQDYVDLKAHADSLGIEFLSTPFSIPDADFLHSLDLAAYKVSSGDLNNIPFLEHLAEFEKPILLSTGMGTLDEIRESLEALQRKNADVVLLQCTSEYPTPSNHANLRVIETLQNTFDVPIGFSDHTESIETCVYTASLGAVLVEKHFTLDRTLPGPDQKTSLEPQELAAMIKKIHSTKRGALNVPEDMLGSGEKVPTADELITKKLVRKGIAARRDIQKGETLTESNILIARPEGPIPPKEWQVVLGKHAKQNIPAGTSLSPEMIT